MNVYDAAIMRIRFILNTFPRVYVSFSGGKDSGVMTHMVLNEARKFNRKVGLLFVDLEGQYRLTIEYIEYIYSQYSDVIEPYWISLPLSLRNAVSQFQPQWKCWDANSKELWIRDIPKQSISDLNYFDFFVDGMEFEDFVPRFGDWFSGGMLTACFVGIRTQESLNWWRTIAKEKNNFDGKQYTTRITQSVYNVYPIYDWNTEDIWKYYGKTGLKYNKLYDRMHQAGLTIHQQRICQPYGDDQRKGLWLFQIIEPETWGKVVARVNGANQGALYAKESGNILGNLKISKPDNHSWESFSRLLLESMPKKTQQHYENKIAVFLHWYAERGYPGGIPDEGPINNKSMPSWKRICKSLLRNDYWMKGLSFSQHKSGAYERYLKVMKKRRSEWQIF